MWPGSSETGECIICAEKVALKDFVKVTEQCDHEDNMCRTCVRTHIAHELSDKGNISISCPGYGCLRVLQEQDVERFASMEMFARYQKLAMISALSQMPAFRWCLNPECSSGQIHFSGDKVPIMNCNACGQKSCVLHDLPVDRRLRCIECEKTLATSKIFTFKLLWTKLASGVKAGKEKRKKEKERKQFILQAEIKTAAFMRSEVKTCPKCAAKIQKDGGCDHMKCGKSGCGHEFCWNCLADFAPIRRHGNHYHQPSCKHYA